VTRSVLAMIAVVLRVKDADAVEITVACGLDDVDVSIFERLEDKRARTSIGPLIAD